MEGKDVNGGDGEVAGREKQAGDGEKKYRKALDGKVRDGEVN